MKGRNMTRWRDPAKDPRQEPKSHLITAEGAERLRGILDHLSRVKRPALSAKVGEAAALGDRSENADYTYNKKELNQVIARIRYLTKRLDELTVVDRLPADTGKVYFGAFVTLARMLHRADQTLSGFRPGEGSHYPLVIGLGIQERDDATDSIRDDHFDLAVGQKGQRYIGSLW